MTDNVFQFPAGAGRKNASTEPTLRVVAENTVANDRAPLPHYILQKDVGGITVEVYHDVDPTRLPANVLVAAIPLWESELEEEQLQLDGQIRARAGDWFHMLLQQSGAFEHGRMFLASGQGGTLCPFENVLFVNGFCVLHEALRVACEQCESRDKTLVVPISQFLRWNAMMPLSAAVVYAIGAIELTAEHMGVPFAKIKLVF
jgi:hypothetical protein